MTWDDYIRNIRVLLRVTDGGENVEVLPYTPYNPYTPTYWLKPLHLYTSIPLYLYTFIPLQNGVSAGRSLKKDSKLPA